jgi:hypothetical protein
MSRDPNQPRDPDQFSEAELAEALERYTDPDDPEYDPVFTEKLRRLRPDWFDPDGKPVERN